MALGIKKALIILGKYLADFMALCKYSPSWTWNKGQWVEETISVE